MAENNLFQIEELRKSGWRPTAVLCLIHNKKVLMVYQKEYDIWQLPQGRIEAGEAPQQAFLRELKEELGESAAQTFNINPDQLVFVGQEQHEFGAASRQKLQNKEGIANLKGKAYLALGAEVQNTPSEFAGSHFQEHRFVSHHEGKELADTIRQTGKRRVTQSFLTLLKSRSLID